MAGIIKKAMQNIPGVKKKPSFMDGLKEWATSPGGMVTIILVIGLIAFIEYKTSKK